MFVTNPPIGFFALGDFPETNEFPGQERTVVEFLEFPSIVTLILSFTNFYYP